MEVKTSRGPRDFSSLNALTGAKWCSLDNVYFDSAPPSPTRGKLKTPESESITPDSYQDASSNLCDFEFETSCRFTPENLDIGSSGYLGYLSDQNNRQQHHQDRNYIPTMAFADELFCGGRMLPLKPPPRLQTPPTSGQSSTASSPRSLGSIFKLPFSQWSLWNDEEVDPFLVALNNVREEKRGRTLGNNLRRTRSLSPLRATSTLNGTLEQLHHSGELSHQWSEPIGLLYTHEKLSIESDSTIMLPEPKGVGYARHVRLVKMNNDQRGKIEMDTLLRPAEVTKLQKIKRFLLGKAFLIKDTRGRKLRDPEGNKIAAERHKIFRKFSFKSTGTVHCNEAKRVHVPRTLMQYRRKFFLCLGDGIKSSW